MWNAPNAISLARLLSGPVIASWIIAGKTDAALIGLVVSGERSSMSDGLDTGELCECIQEKDSQHCDRLRSCYVTGIV